MHTVLDMLMRPLLAGHRPGDPRPGESQIEIKWFPAPPKKMPTGLNNEHRTRKPWSPSAPVTMLCLLGADWHILFCFLRGEGGKKRHWVSWAPALHVAGQKVHGGGRERGAPPLL